MGLGYSNTAGKFRFFQSRRQERGVEVDLGRLQCGERDGPELGPAATRWRGQWSALTEVVANGQHEEVLRHMQGFLIGFPLSHAVTEIRKCHDVAASFPVGFEQCLVVLHWAPHIVKSRSLEHYQALFETDRKAGGY